jgi:transposase
MIGLPTLGELDRSTSLRIWLASEPADMRCGFDRLAELAGSITGDDPLSGHLFPFRGRGGDRLRILYSGS